jgi:triphosphoribosyl-dephospho-CoA synthase
MSALGADLVAAAYRDACLAELEALKPGNVHRHDPADADDLADFALSAALSAPPIARPGATVGERILGAIEATRTRISWNTNLGIVLLAAPIALAAEKPGPVLPAIGDILRGLTVDDAARTFAAIRLANPGGIGRVEDHDIRDAPRVTLAEAMAAAADRDRIALAYVTGFEEIVSTGLPALAAARARGLDDEWSTAALYMAFLASAGDSHVRRKHGEAAADLIRREACALVVQAPIGPDSRAALGRFHADLKARGHNPGTSADFTVATLFLDKIIALSGAKT